MKKQVLLTLAVVLLALAGCKTPTEFIKQVKQEPNPASYKAGKVEVVFEGNFPEKYFTKKMTMDVTPVLTTTDGKTYRGTTVTYQGEKVKGNDKVIRYKVGGKYTQTAVFDFEEGMESSTLSLEATVKTSKKEYALPATVVGKGVNTTPLLVSVKPGSGDLQAMIIPDKFQRIIEERTDAQIMYLINQSNIRDSELKKDELQVLTNSIKAVKNDSSRQVKSVEISSYASPDGGMDLNERLANNRGKSADAYINKEMKKIKASVSVDSRITAEDWEGFQQLVNVSSIEDKALILRVLSMYTDPDQREEEIKKLSVAYKTLADEILPQLRRSKMSLIINIVGRSDEEIAALATSDASKLSEEEILYAATLTSDLAQKQAIYEKATELYPQSVRAYNNLGYAYYERNNMNAAENAFKKALDIDAANTTANYNMGLVKLANMDLSGAEQFFGKAGGIGKGLDYANGVIAILRGNYKKAAQLFGNSASNNAALANILNNDLAAARRALENNKNANATTYYLKAILAARQNNKSEYQNALAQAVKMNINYQARAAKDVEFDNVR